MASASAKFRGRIVLLIAVAFLAVAVSLAALSAGPRFITVSANPSVSIDTNSLRSGDVRFYTYKDHAGDQIRFVLARDSTGRVKGVFDACQRCSTYGKGYTSSHGDLVCGYCGNRYKLEAMETGIASCVPVRLPMQVTAHTVNIRPADLEQQRRLF
jgi:uncharacterized membrane protein